MAQKWFQSTPLHKGRLEKVLDALGGFYGFNPRPCIRGDAVAQGKADYVEVFQSTPLHKGRHGFGGDGVGAEEVSIHAPA